VKRCLTCLSILAMLLCLAASPLVASDPHPNGDGGPAPICPPGTDCVWRLPDGQLNDRPVCCGSRLPRLEFGDINALTPRGAPDSELALRQLATASGGRTTPVCGSGEARLSNILVQEMR
jgi:hypothetical protein